MEKDRRFGVDIDIVTMISQKISLTDEEFWFSVAV